MLRRLVIASLLLAHQPGLAHAQPVEVRATCASAVPRDAAQIRMLREELARALGEIAASRRYTLDVSIVQLAVTASRDELEVRVELRGMLSDDHRRVLWSSMARATARGDAKDRTMIQRDAYAAAADRIAAHVHAHVESQDHVATK